jgi:hypothetical protein
MSGPTPTTPRVIEKSTWGDGPWQGEPDRVEWTHAGLPCLAARGPDVSGHWCGYVAVPPGHPLHGTPYNDADVDVHGGLTYAHRCQGEICHVPAPGEPDDVWWFGFDCAHAGDFSPGLDATLRQIGARDRGPAYDHAAAIAANSWTVDVYRTLAYVQAETNQLADQLAAIAGNV